MKTKKMEIKEFAQEAIKNGHGSDLCGGWDWIRANLDKLDYIFKQLNINKPSRTKRFVLKFFAEDLI